MRELGDGRARSLRHGTGVAQCWRRVKRAVMVTVAWPVITASKGFGCGPGGDVGQVHKVLSG
jgi:hypothetical protein